MSGAGAHPETSHLQRGTGVPNRRSMITIIIIISSTMIIAIMTIAILITVNVAIHIFTIRLTIHPNPSSE